MDLGSTKISIDTMRENGKMIRGMEWVSNNSRISQRNILEILLMISIMVLGN
jgi:hypothetical protein